MKIDAARCVGCGMCRPYCPAGAIGRDPATGKSVIDQGRCLECHICFRSGVCPVHALEIEDLQFPRDLRSTFSDVLCPHKSTGVLGRGTEEMKTNDVTGRLPEGLLGVSVELGRPGIGASFADVEVIARALVAFGVVFEKSNPVAGLIIDETTGAFRPDVLGERVLSALLEFQIPEKDLEGLVALLHRVEKDVSTVFSVGVSMKMPEGASGNPLAARLARAGIFCRENGKTNVGLGRPLHEGDAR